MSHEEGQQILADAESAGAQYATDQIEGGYFKNWVYEQMVEAEHMRKADPSSVIPLKTKADYRKLARNMLQQLEWDTRREMDTREILQLSGAAGVFNIGSAAWARDKYGITEREVVTDFYKGFSATLEHEGVAQLAGEVEAIDKELRSARSKARRRGSMRERRWTYEGYWNVVMGANRSPQDVVFEFGLDAEGTSRRSIDEWLGWAESEAWAMGRRGGPLPEEWEEFHQRALQSLQAVVERTEMAEARQRQPHVYGVEWEDRKGALHIEGPFTSDAQVDRVLLRVLPIDPDAMAFQSTAKQFAAKKAKIEGSRTVQDYVAVDTSGRVVGGPYKDYGEAKRHADRAGGYVQFTMRESRGALKSARVEPVFDPFYIIQGLYKGSYSAGDSFGFDDEETAIDEARKLLHAPYFEGDYVRVITRDGDLVWDSRGGERSQYGTWFLPPELDEMRRPYPHGAKDRKSAWMRAFQDASVALGAPHGQLRWQDAEYLFHQGVNPAAAARQLYGQQRTGEARRGRR
jgi:hypothetical protein